MLLDVVSAMEAARMRTVAYPQRSCRSHKIGGRGQLLTNDTASHINNNQSYIGLAQALTLHILSHGWEHGQSDRANRQVSFMEATIHSSPEGGPSLLEPTINSTKK